MDGSQQIGATQRDIMFDKCDYMVHRLAS